MNKRVVVALGGNALGNNLREQMVAVRDTARALVDLVEQGYDVVIAEISALPAVGLRGDAPGLYRLRPSE